LLDGGHVAQDRAGDPACPAPGGAGPLDEPRQLSRGLSTTAVRALPAEQRARGLDLGAVERRRLLARRLRLREVPLPGPRALLLPDRRHPDSAVPVLGCSPLPLGEP